MNKYKKNIFVRKTAIKCNNFELLFSYKKQEVKIIILRRQNNDYIIQTFY